MNKLKFFVYQVLLSFLGIAVEILFREFIYESSFFNNRYIPALIKTSIIGVLLYFVVFKLFKNNKVTIQDFNTYCCFYFRSNIGGVNGEFCGHVNVGVLISLN
jgi:hypothetical protein